MASSPHRLRTKAARLLLVTLCAPLMASMWVTLHLVHKHQVEHHWDLPAHGYLGEELQRHSQETASRHGDDHDHDPVIASLDALRDGSKHLLTLEPDERVAAAQDSTPATTFRQGLWLPPPGSHSSSLAQLCVLRL